MTDHQMYESFRKMSELTLQVQHEWIKLALSVHQEWLKRWSRMWPAAATVAADPASDKSKSFPSVDELFANATALMKESIDAANRVGEKFIEDTRHMTEIKSPEEFRKAAEDHARAYSEAIQGLTEKHLKEFHSALEKCLGNLPKGKKKPD